MVEYFNSEPKIVKKGDVIFELGPEYFDFENIEDAIDVLNDQATRIKNPTYSYLKEAYEMGAKALNIIKTIYIQKGDQ